MKKIVPGILVTFLIVFLGYSVGPRVSDVVFLKEMPSLGISIDQVEKFIEKKESKLQLKPDNGARIAWTNEDHNQTEYALLYLHGFATSWYEGSPVHMDFAERYGMNLYLPLLAEHGIVTTESLVEMSPDRLYESAKEALVIAHLLGKKVIIMGTSTGGTLGLKLAAEYPDLVEGLILYSPNVRIIKDGAFLMEYPWGLQLAQIVQNNSYHVPNPNASPKECQYWDCKYRLEAVVSLQQLVSKTMNVETFNRVKVPVFVGYYYKDEEHQDTIVHVDAILWMFDELGTSELEKEKMAFPEAGTHKIGSALFSGAWEDVEMASFAFVEDKLGLSSKN